MGNQACTVVSSVRLTAKIHQGTCRSQKIICAVQRKAWQTTQKHAEIILDMRHCKWHDCGMEQLHPALNVETWQIGDQIKSLEDGVSGAIVAATETLVTVKWQDGKTSRIGRYSNVAGRFEKVC